MFTHVNNMLHDKMIKNFAGLKGLGWMLFNSCIFGLNPFILILTF